MPSRISTTENSSIASANILRIDASARHAASYGRSIADSLVDRLLTLYPDGKVVRRDLATSPVPSIDERWVTANFASEPDRTDDQRTALALSDTLVAELIAADIIIIACPIYNFSVPSALKAWIDQVCRARVTFTYGPDGPQGLLAGKRAYLVMTSGGTPVESPIDFATGYMRHILAFIGIRDVTVIAADRLMFEAEEKLDSAHRTIEALAAA